MDDVRFIVDSMLGNVARELRLLGYDASFARSESDWQILRIAQNESRILLTRDRELILRARNLPALLVEEDDPRRQTASTFRELGLDAEGAKLLSRCLEDGTLLTDISSGEAASRVPPYVAATQKSFSACAACGRIYWHGTHAEKMVKRAREILEGLKG